MVDRFSPVKIDAIDEEDTEEDSSQYTDSPEFPNNTIDKEIKSPISILQSCFSAFTQKSALPFSAFNTPFLNSSIGKGQGNVRYNYGIQIDTDKFAEKGIYDLFETNHDQYPSWAPEDKVPITRIEIQAIFSQLREVFGFQEDSMRNMYDYLMKLLDSRASRMGPSQSLRTLHADYIGGLNSNFKKWYFASQLDIDDTIGFANSNSDGNPKRLFLRSQGISTGTVLPLSESEKRWGQNMNCLSALDCAVQIALYLLIWGESNNIRFMPECICFIFKCCNDYFYSINFNEPIFQATELSFLNHLIDPLYRYYFDQSNELHGKDFISRDKDHSSVIGYDDMNQLFWYRKGLERIKLIDKRSLMDLPAIDRYQVLNDVAWEKAFYKTYHEKRTWLHLLTNFNRIWIIHICMFWFYTSFNSSSLFTKNYRLTLDNQPTLQVKLSVMSFAGPLAILCNLVATVGELIFVPRKWPGAEPLFPRAFKLLLLLVINLSPSVYIFGFNSLDSTSTLGLILSISQLSLSLLIVIWFSLTPLGSLFGGSYFSNGRRFLPTKVFTGSLSQLRGRNRLSSYALWLLVFSSKFVESYFFLTLSLRDPIRELGHMFSRRCIGETYFGPILCRYQPWILLSLMILTDLIMFFLDTYLWYITWNTLFSVSFSFHIGVSIWTPWRNIFSRLPKRIFSKVIATNTDRNVKPKLLVSQIWNAIIISMYREHLISFEIVNKLLYQEVMSPNSQEIILKEPKFFVSQDDLFMKSSVFEAQSEAQRRITFFAQSLATPMPEVLPTSCMPSFTVLVPHYSERITLSLKEIIREEDQYSHITLLEYLKQLHPIEWDNFVQDTKILAHEADEDNLKSLSLSPTLKYEDLAYYCVGFKSSNPEYILRTRIWASLRSQTLYRTISGFMNYSRAIKLLYDVENRTFDNGVKNEEYRMEESAMMALRKFRIVVSMQRMNQFTQRELEDTEFILRAYPEVQVSYLENEISEDIINYYSCLIDGSCEIMENGKRRPKYRIKLSGNPILGDGKSDNQNNALIFSRGEYIQLVDANQDNYLEECMKIRSVLAEFEEMVPPTDPYSMADLNSKYREPVAIIGTREYIFSENIGILGDVAAAKEQTFGTLFARTLAQIGGKLHYGHPDFLNTTFMTTRGGVSKAQKGLHLNEDVYAGMNALLRGGRIKHCEYVQCGKGRDLGFGSILNFTTKIGAGMGEQILSREYFYIGTHLPIDRFLSLYYAHLGFHLNNVFIILSTKLFLLVCVHMAALSRDTVICEYDKNRPITDVKRPPGCSNLIPVIQWLQHCIISIFMVFGMSFVPLCVQEITEKGVWRALTRLCKHFGSLSPFFEVFVCKIYALSLASDLKIGGARYIATGRGFATTRVPFVVLYSRFASESLYFGGMALCMLLYCSVNMWNIPLLYMWYTVSALCISPFLFNPNQFLWAEFFLDYKVFLHWLSSGNSRSKELNWSSFTRNHRAQFTGSNRNVNTKNEVEKRDFKKPSSVNLFFADLLPHIGWVIMISIAYLYLNSQNDSREGETGNTILRLAVISFSPILLNAAVVLLLFLVSVIFGPLLTAFLPKFPSFIAATCHTICLLSHIASFELLYLCQNWNFSLTMLGLCNTILIQSLFYKILIQVLLTRETKYDASNRAWWSGKWITSGFGWRILTEPIREYFCKIMEMSWFAADILLGHALLFVQIPVIIIPYIDKWHSLILLWLKPDKQFRPRILHRKEKRRRKVTIYLYSMIFLINLVLFVAIPLVPYILFRLLEFDAVGLLPEIFLEIIQPEEAYNSRKGLLNYKGSVRKH